MAKGSKCKLKFSQKMDEILLKSVELSQEIHHKVNWNFVAQKLSESLSMPIERKQAENRYNNQILSAQSFVLNDEEKNQIWRLYFLNHSFKSITDLLKLKCKRGKISNFVKTEKEKIGRVMAEIKGAKSQQRNILILLGRKSLLKIYSDHGIQAHDLRELSESYKSVRSQIFKISKTRQIQNQQIQQLGQLQKEMKEIKCRIVQIFDQMRKLYYSIPETKGIKFKNSNAVSKEKHTQLLFQGSDVIEQDPLLQPSVTEEENQGFFENQLSNLIEPSLKNMDTWIFDDDIEAHEKQSRDDDEISELIEQERRDFDMANFSVDYFEDEFIPLERQ